MRIPNFIVGFLGKFFPVKVYYGYFIYGFGWCVSGISEVPYTDRNFFEVKEITVGKIKIYSVREVKCCS